MHKNIWKFWSLFCVTGAVIFILIPQIWIAFSSLLRTSGNFTLELNNDKINIIEADLEGFRVINDNQNKIYFFQTQQLDTRIDISNHIINVSPCVIS